MNKRKTIYSGLQKGKAVFLILTLCWLTISAPFVMAAQQDLAKQQKLVSSASSTTGCDDTANEEDTGGNGIEEKAPSGFNLSEEFLHDHHIAHHFFSRLSLYHKLENADSYTAFHGELLVPPPNAA